MTSAGELTRRCSILVLVSMLNYTAGLFGAATWVAFPMGVLVTLLAAFAWLPPDER